MFKKIILCMIGAVLLIFGGIFTVGLELIEEQWFLDFLSEVQEFVNLSSKAFLLCLIICGLAFMVSGAVFFAMALDDFLNAPSKEPK